MHLVGGENIKDFDHLLRETEEHEAFLVLSIVAFLANVVGNRHTRRFTHILEAVAQHAAGITVLVRGGHESLLFNTCLTNLTRSLHLRPSLEELEALKGALCSTVITITEEVEKKVCMTEAA